MPVGITGPQVILQFVVFFFVFFFENYSFSSGHNRRQILIYPPTFFFMHVVSHIDPLNELSIGFVVKLFFFDRRVTNYLLVHYWSFSNRTYLERLPHGVIVSVVISIVTVVKTSGVEI